MTQLDTPQARSDAGPRAPVPWVLLATTLTFVAVAAGLVAGALAERARMRAEYETTEVVRSIERRMDMYLALLRGTAALFAYDRDGFRRFEERLRRQSFPGIQGTGWTARLRPGDAEKIVAQAHADGLTGFHLWPAHDGERHAIVYLEPQDPRNIAALGYDMHFEAVRRVAMDRARDTGLPAASGQVRLVQEIGREVQPGFLIYVPVYEGGNVPATIEERRERLMGFAYAPVRAGDMFSAIFDGWEDAPTLAVYDGDEMNPERLLFARDSGDRNVRPLVRQVSLAGRTWTIEVRPHVDFISDGRIVGTLIFVLGSLLTLLLVRTARARDQASLERAVALEALTRESQLRETFMGVLGHDLRNPLAAARIAAHSLGRHCGEAQQPRLERLEQSISRAGRLVDQLLDLTRARLGGGIHIEPQAVLLSPFLRDIVNEARLAANSKLDVEIEVDEDLFVQADPDRLAQIMSNLTGNALAHGKPPITLRARRDGDQASIVLTNHGPPIPPDVLESLFDPFRRGTAASGGGTGLGLGLYISRQLALAHGGSLEAISFGDETSFELRLPLDRKKP